MQQYARGLEGKEHPFLSPIDMHEKVLSEFPPTRIFLAGADPLWDDGYAFGFWLMKLSRDVKITEFKLLPHGFLNYDIIPFMAQECGQAIFKIA